MRWSKALTLTTVKLVVFAAACVVVTIGLAVRVGNINLFSHRTGYTALLSDAAGLRSGDPVKIAGVTVGQVSSISVDHGHAVVQFGLDDKVRLRASTGVGMRWLDVIGDKVLYLYPGSVGGWLRPGGTLGLANDVADANIGQFLSTLSPFLRSIDPKEANAFLVSISDALQGNESTVRSLFDNAARITSTLGADNNEIGAVIDEYDQVTSALAAHRGDISTLVSNLSTVAHSLAGHNSLLDAMVVDLARVTGEFGGLLQANQSNLDSTIANLGAVARVIEAHQSELAKSLATLPQGLAPYEQVTSTGQWFNIQVLYSCMANQTNCSYYNAFNQPGGGPTSSLPPPGSASGRPGRGGGNVGLPSLFGPVATSSGRA
jgi:phospholipid/cholesterol/gamma-HCH transport system substrate-binding protein